jgi:hypothetical protein
MVEAEYGKFNLPGSYHARQTLPRRAMGRDPEPIEDEKVAMSEEPRQGELAPQAENAVLASDAEREATVSRLGEAATEGRLTLEEYSDRIGQAYSARTRGDLEQLTRDLPAPSETGTAPAAYQPSTSGHTSWSISPIGGLKRAGHWRMDRETVGISLVGGMRLDLREAEFTAPEVTLTKVSLIGGVRIAVPPGIRVEVTNFSLIGGRRIDVDERVAPGAPVLRIRAFGLIGGVRVQHTLRRERHRDRRRERRRERL